ncbi:unnamed protein product, partial [Polarella glacialis]
GGGLSLRGLADFAWALGASSSFGAAEAEELLPLWESVQRELLRRLQERAPEDCASKAPAELADFASKVLVVLSACNLSGFLLDGTVQLARQTLLSLGRALQRLRAPQRSETPGLAEWQRAEGPATPGQPRVVLDLADMLVVQKPPGWQVDDGKDEPDPDAGRGGERLSSFVQSLLPVKRWPILGETTHQRGFIHRLDVPTSGLILVAKTYDAYYDLQLQLVTGKMPREYVVLCHGWVNPKRREIQARVQWGAHGRDAASSVSLSGRPSRTKLKVLAHALLGGQAFSLLAIRIATGRRHQIRLHTAHVGFPTACE